MTLAYKCMQEYTKGGAYHSPCILYIYILYMSQPRAQYITDHFDRVISFVLTNGLRPCEWRLHVEYV